MRNTKFFSSENRNTKFVFLNSLIYRLNIIINFLLTSIIIFNVMYYLRWRYIIVSTCIKYLCINDKSLRPQLYFYLKEKTQNYFYVLKNINILFDIFVNDQNAKVRLICIQLNLPYHLFDSRCSQKYKST